MVEQPRHALGVFHERDELRTALGVPGVMAYGATATEAASKVVALATEVLLDEIANGEREPSQLGDALCPQ